MDKKQMNDALRSFLLQGKVRKRVLDNYARVGDLIITKPHLYRSAFRLDTLKPFLQAYKKDRPVLDILMQKKYDNLSIGDITYESRDKETVVMLSMRLRIMLMTYEDQVYGLVKVDIEVDESNMSNNLMQFGRTMFREFRHYLKQDLKELNLEYQDKIGNQLLKPEFENLKGRKNIVVSLTYGITQ